MRKWMMTSAVILVIFLFGSACGNSGSTGGGANQQSTTSSEPVVNTDAPSLELEKKKITIRLNWKFKGEFTPFYVTKEKGIFEKYGLEVEVLEGTSSVQTLQVVSQNKDDIGVTSTVEPIQGVEKGMGVTMIASYMSRSPIMILSYGDKPIRTPKDLEGKTLATSISSTFTSVYDKFLEVNGVDSSKVKTVKVETGARNTLFLNREVDGVAVFSTNEYPMFEQKQGEKLETLYMADYGFDIAGLTLVAGNQFLKDNPNTTKALLAAVNEGFNYTIEHPEESAAIMKRLFPDTVDEALTAEQIKRTGELAIFDDKPFGFINETNISQTIDVLYNSGMIKTKKQAVDYYTNDYFTP